MTEFAIKGCLEMLPEALFCYIFLLFVLQLYLVLDLYSFFSLSNTGVMIRVCDQMTAESELTAFM